MRRGKLIALYGINNLGKSTQTRLLTQNLNDSGIITESVKYGIYGLKPSGPLLDGYLRELPGSMKNPNAFTPREFQLIQVINRFQFQPELQEKLRRNTSVVAEDYYGTGIAWGKAFGVDLDLLLYLNSKFLKEDMAFLFEGDRFVKGIEKGHTHESNSERTELARKAHEELAERFGWIKINANRPEEVIAEELFSHVKTLYTKPPLNFYVGIEC
jgi:thymidylate kinase